MPVVVRWPAGLEGSRQVDDVVHFTDWLPALLSAAGIDAPREVRQLDGIDAWPAILGHGLRSSPPRFWQWNRYTPVGECNAAMRDGDWKLVRPAIDAYMQVSREDFAMDVDAKMRPERYGRVIDVPEPERAAADVPPPQLFNLRDDPSESRDLAASEPERVRRMESALAAWFEDVEGERRRIVD